MFKWYSQGRKKWPSLVWKVTWPLCTSIGTFKFYNSTPLKRIFPQLLLRQCLYGLSKSIKTIKTMELELIKITILKTWTRKPVRPSKDSSKNALKVGFSALKRRSVLLWQMVSRDLITYGVTARTHQLGTSRMRRLRMPKRDRCLEESLLYQVMIIPKELVRSQLMLLWLKVQK